MSSPETHPLLAEFPIVVTIPVQWGEMDAYGHVNNATYFRYLESARVAHLEACGFLASYDRDRIGAILHSTECRFRQALRHPDTVQVGCRTADIGEDRYTNHYRVVSLAHDVIVAEGSAVVVSFDYVRREKTQIPPEVREAIARLEAR
jgi:acyl-CoA thioester hydrolase